MTRRRVVRGKPLRGRRSRLSRRFTRRPEKARTLRRARARVDAKLRADVEKLALLAEGGRHDRPIEVASPAQVEVRAQAMLCPHCGEPPHLLEHRAEVFAGERLRVVRLRCGPCGSERAVYFRLAAPLQS